MAEIQFTSKAYCKIILHAAKYPHCSVNGVLLAKSSSKTKELIYVDSIPLFHISLNLTPMAEIALIQIDQYASQHGLVIAGYYVAHENIRENSFEKSCNRILDKIADNFGSACLIVVDNQKLNLHLDNIAIRVAQYSDGKCKPVDTQNITLNPNHTLDTCSSLLGNHVYKDLVDFDNHLDDISLDWRNVRLNKEIDNVS